MEKNSQQPGAWDAVLGNQTSPPTSATVLGGLPGVKQRLANDVKEIRIAALKDALNYGVAGLKLIREAMHDCQISKSAHSILWQWQERRLRQNLKPATAKLIADLEDIILKPSPLKYSVIDDGWVADYWWVTFVWELDRLGKFSIRKLFEITPIKTETFLQYDRHNEIWSDWIAHTYDAQKWDGEIRQKFEIFIDFMRLYLENFQICQISFTAPDLETYRAGDVDSIQGITSNVRSAVLLGRTADGDWVAIARKSRSDYFDCYQKDGVIDFDSKSLSKFGQHTCQFLQKLEPTLQQLPNSGDFSYNNSQDAVIFKPNYVWEVAPTREMVLNRLLKSTEIVIVRKFHCFSAQSNSNNKSGRRYKKLAKFFQMRLQNPREYILFNTYLYVVGKINIKDWAGILTRIY